MPKFLFCASTASHIRNFHLPYMQKLQEQGYEVWCAVEKPDSIPYANQVKAFPFAKNMLNAHNILAVFRIRKLLIKERFEGVSTNTGLASAILRLAVLLMPKKTRPTVFYIAHGFLFHKRDGLRKWIYLLPEIICAPVTNVLMVMNQEDLGIAQKNRLYKDKLLFINGIGIDLSRFQPILPQLRLSRRISMGFSEHDYLFVYAAEFSNRKNQASLIRAFTKAAPYIPNAHLLLAGVGAQQEACKSLVSQLNMEQQIHLLGYVSKIQELYPLCDCAVSTSKIEGLPFNIMEAMSCGLPILVSDIKGHRELAGMHAQALFKTEEELCERLIQYARMPLCSMDWSDALEPCALDRVLPVVLGEYMHANC